MKMDDFDIIDVFRFAIASVPHIADYLSGRHYAALLQIFAIREILAQVGVIIISLSVKAAYAQPPAPVLVPPDGLHITGFYGYNRRTHLPHHIVPEMRPRIPITPGSPEIIIIVILKPLCNGGKGF